MQKETFDGIWKELILPTYRKYNERTGGLMCPDSGYRDVRDFYDEMIAFAKKHYMSEKTDRLNRHKVAAALMIAILKAKPIKKVDPIYYQPDSDGKVTVWPFNEALAITVSLSVLRAFILERVDQAFAGAAVPRSIFADVCEQDRVIFDEGIPLSQRERKEWEWELYQIRQDGAYNLLVLAHVLSGIEKNARLQYFLEHKDEEPKRPLLSDDAGQERNGFFDEAVTIDEIF